MGNVIGELEATNIKEFEINQFFGTSFLVRTRVTRLFALWTFFKRMVCRRHVSQFNDKVALRNQLVSQFSPREKEKYICYLPA